MKNVPDNLQVFATHGSYSVPPFLEPYIRKEFNERLRRNFSDFATADLLYELPRAQRLRPKRARLTGDTNRALDAADLFRETDFNDIPVFTQPLPDVIKERSLAESYIPYHRALLDRMLGKHGDPRNTLVAFDLHDTGNLMLGEKQSQDVTRLEKRGQHMPLVVISNNPGATQSAPEKMMQDLASAFKTHFGMRDRNIDINEMFKGGYVTKHYGNPQNPLLENAVHGERALIQVELARELYLDERTQQIIPSGMIWTREKLMKVFTEVADGYTHKAKS